MGGGVLQILSSGSNKYHGLVTTVVSYKYLIDALLFCVSFGRTVDAIQTYPTLHSLYC